MVSVLADDLRKFGVGRENGFQIVIKKKVLLDEGIDTKECMCWVNFFLCCDRLAAINHFWLLLFDLICKLVNANKRYAGGVWGQCGWCYGKLIVGGVWGQFSWCYGKLMIPGCGEGSQKNQQAKFWGFT